jgi:hypothetical protein
VPRPAYDSTTQAELIERLKRRGIDVTTKQLAHDVDDGYLPGRHAGGDVSLALARATRLYRLRRLKVEGKLLRFFLFLADGWGWERICEACLQGLEKANHFQLLGVTEVMREPNHEGLSNLGSIALQRHENRLDRYLPNAQIPLETALTIWGILLFGKPLKGGDFSAWRTLDYFFPSEDEGRFFQGPASQGRTDLENATPECVEASRIQLREALQYLRSFVQAAGRVQNPRYNPGNPLNLFGALSWRKQIWENGPMNMTAPQFLGLFMAYSISGTLSIERLVTSFFEAIGTHMANTQST